MLTGIVSYDKLNVADPIAVGIDASGLHWLAPIIKLGVIFGLNIGDLGHVGSASRGAFSTPWPTTARCC